MIAKVHSDSARFVLACITPDGTSTYTQICCEEHKRRLFALAAASLAKKIGLIPTDSDTQH